MKMFFLCEYRSPDFWVCYGVLENGFMYASHICSHPIYAPGDLYFSRENRISALKKIWGILPEDTKNNYEIIVIKSKEDIPQWFYATEKQQDELKSKYDEYTTLVDKPFAEIVVEMSDGTIERLTTGET